MIEVCLEKEDYHYCLRFKGCNEAFCCKSGFTWYNEELTSLMLAWNDELICPECLRIHKLIDNL